MQLLLAKTGSAGKDAGADAAAEELQKNPSTESGFYPRIEIEEMEAGGPGKAEEGKNLAIKLGQALASEPRLFCLSGEHAAASQLFTAMAKASANPGLILLDAHPDCRREYKGKPDWIRHLVETNVLKPQNIVMAGTRSFLPEELDFVRMHKVKHFDMRRIANEGINEIADIIMENARQWDSCQVSIDMDVVDPAFAPGVESPEPGGLSSREILALAQRLKNLRNIRIVDVCEIFVGNDRNGSTSALAAKLLKEFI